MEEDGGKCLTSGSQPGSKVAFVCLCVSSCTCVCVRRGFRNALGPAPPSSCDSPGWSQLLGLFSWRFPPPAAWTRRSLPPGCPPGRPPVGLAQGGRGLSWGRHPLPQAAMGHLAQCLASLRWPRRGGVPRRRAGGLCGAARTLGSTAPRPAQLGCSARLVAGPFSPQSPPG